MLPFPRLLEYGNIKPTLPPISKLSSSPLHVGFVYSTGLMYMRGSGANYKLGTGNTTDVMDRWISVPYNVIDFWVCNSGTLVRSYDNKLYSVGNIGTYYGTSGTYSTWTEVSNLFVGIDISEIKDIAFTAWSTSGSTLILMNDGSLYGFGANVKSELGLTAGRVAEPVLIDTEVQAIAGNMMGGASFHYIKNGKYYRSGANVGSNLGTTADISTFTLLDVPEYIHSFAVLRQSTQLLCSDSTGTYSLYIAGSNNDFSRGTGSTDSTVYSTFRKVSSLQNVIINDDYFKYAAMGHVNIVKDSNAIYTCGSTTSAGGGLARDVTVIERGLLGEVQFSTGLPSIVINSICSQSSSLVIYCLVNNQLYWAGAGTYFTDQTDNLGQHSSFEAMLNMPAA